MIVARVDIRARKRHIIEAPLDPDVAEQADHRRELEAERNRANLAVVDRDDLDFALAPERNRLLPMDNLEWLVRRVEKEGLFHPDPRSGACGHCARWVEGVSRLRNCKHLAK